MPKLTMQLKVLTPFATFAEKSAVLSIVAETLQGFVGILPHRLDFVAILATGVFSYTTETDGEVFIAVDEGVLVKAGDQVLVSTRGAIGGVTLDQLPSLIEKQFLQIDEQEKIQHSTLLKLETGFLKHFARFHQQ